VRSRLPSIVVIAALVTLLPACQYLLAGVSIGVSSISSIVREELARRPVTEQVVETPYIQTADMATNLQIVDADLRERGYAALGQPQQTTLAGQGLHDARLRLGAGECYAVAAVGDAYVADLAIAIFDARNQPVEVVHGPHPVARACVDEAGVYTVRLQMRQGQGTVRYAAYHWTRGTHGPFGVEGLLYVRLAEATALLAARGYTPDPSFAPIKSNFRRQGALASHSLGIREGGCVIVVAVGGAGVHDLDAQLGTEGGPPAVDAQPGGALVALEACDSSHTRTALHLASARGSGEYFFQVFRRTHTNAM
jgi:hypothetical protein